MIRSALIATLMLAFFAFASEARAVPILQLYLEGATYDHDTESWTLSPEGSSSGEPFRIWTIGNTEGPGGAGTISDVKLAFSWDESFGDLQINLTPGTTGDLGGFTDPSLASVATTDDVLHYVSDGELPLLGDGTVLPSHGEYVDGVVWKEFQLGDFDLADSPVADFIDLFPDGLGVDAGQINVYEVSVLMADGSSAHDVSLHLDLYNHVQAGNKIKYKFSPFSHDADGTVTIIPEPASLGLLGLGSLVLARRPRRKGTTK